MPAQDPIPERTSTRRQPWPIDATCLLAIEAIALIALQISSAPVLIATHSVRYMPPLLYLDFLSKLPWTTLDLFLAAVVVLTFVAIVVLDRIRGSVTLLLKRVLASDRSAVLFTVGCCFVLVRACFAPGRLTWGADASHHAVHTWIASEAFRTGTLVVWTPLMSVGSYFLQYYGWVYATVSGAVAAGLGDLDWGIKLTLGLFHVLSGLTCYLYVRALCGSRAAGFVAAIAYVSTFWHTQLVVTMGRYSAGVVFALLPLPFYFLESIRRNRSNRRSLALGGAVSIALLAFTHPGYAFWAVGFLLLFVAVSLAAPPAHRPPLIETAVMIGLGLALASCLLLPMILEKAWTGLSQGFSMAAQAKPTLGHLLSWSSYRVRLTGMPAGQHWFGGYIGVSLIVLVVAAYVSRIGRFRLSLSRDLPLLGLLVSLSITFAHDAWWLKRFDVVQAMGASRFLVFAVFFLAVLAGLSIKVLRARWHRHPRTLVLIITVILVDLGTTTFQQHFHFLSAPEVSSLGDDLYAALANQGTSPAGGPYQDARLLHTAKPVNSFMSVSARAPTPFGLFEEHPRADRAFVRPFIAKLRSDLDGDRQHIARYLESETGSIAMDGLRLLNTRHYVQAEGYVPTAHLDLSPVSPIVVSARLEPYKPGPGAASVEYDMIEQMDVDNETGSCGSILLRDGTGRVLADRPRSRLITHTVLLDRASIRFSVSHDAFCRLSYGYYPGLVVALNGERVEYFPTADGFIGLSVPAGEHTITISGQQSTLRRTIFWIDVILVGAALYWVRQGRTFETDQEGR